MKTPTAAKITPLAGCTPALWHALPVLLLVFGLYAVWFAVANRYIIFLYHHEMGPKFPDTSPFSAVTAGRYWMAGLVAGGPVLVLNVSANLLLGRLHADYCPPAWWRVWLLCVPALVVGIPAITMTVNQPTLPPANAAQTTVATLVGVALALLPNQLAARRPAELVWLAADGLALAPIFYFLAALENAPDWWQAEEYLRLWILAVGIGSGVIALLFITGLRVWRRKSASGAAALFAAGCCVVYLLLPLVHHLYVGLLEGHFYITTANNFFADTILWQAVTWLVVAMLVWGVSDLRRRLVAVLWPGAAAGTRNRIRQS
ncbi:MAG: hypothetical protein D6768_14130 [Chloroflexi bacterium]|nr:MAG: hypothetical protein D6768_14130 [Chloroflexota bacterium]